MEELCRRGLIDLYFGDESHFCSEGYVPRGWQFKDETVDIKVERGFKINCFAMISRQSKCIYKTNFTNINGQFIVEMLNEFADTLDKETVLVLDNASFHKSKVVKERLEEWQEKGLYIFYLPLLPRIEYCRNPVENPENIRNKTTRLSFKRNFTRKTERKAG